MKYYFSLVLLMCFGVNLLGRNHIIDLFDNKDEELYGDNYPDLEARKIYGIGKMKKGREDESTTEGGTLRECSLNCV
ncbi:MAG: hypothetical protein ACI94Y_001701 [Maribacter sp.]|jgi:hypothetical protein